MAEMNYLQQELYALVKTDDKIFDFLQDSALDGLWYWDIENPEEEWMNARFWITLGYDPERMPHKSSAWQTIIHPDDLKVAIENFQRHCKDPNHPYDQIVRYTHADGSTVWIRCRGLAIRDAEGRAVRMLGAHTDITKQKQTEADLQKRIELYDHIIEGADIGTWSWNVQTGQTILNERWVGMLGYTLEELEPLSVETWKRLCHPDDLKNVERLLQQHFAGSLPKYECEMRMKHRNGNWVWVASKGRIVSRNGTGEPLQMTGFHQEITARKLAEEALRKGYERNKLFIEQAPSAIAMFDNEICYLAASQQWLRDYRLNHDDVIGLSHYEVFPEIGEEWKAIHQECLGGALRRCDEDMFRREDGSVQWITWEVRPWYDDSGAVGGLLMYTADISKVKNAEQEIRSLLDITTDQNQRLLNFAHIVSHNLRSHSSNMEMILALTENDVPEATKNEYYPMLKMAVEKLQETIKHLTEVVSINTKTSKSLKKVNLHTAVLNAIENVSAIAAETETEVRSTVAEDIVVQAIPAYLDSIILNLVTNAIKYRSTERESYVIISAEQTSQYTILRFKDNGLGINMERYGTKLFGMYKTFHGMADSRGIGLFITKNQIDAMGGKVEVESEVNVGSTFSVYLKHE